MLGARPRRGTVRSRRRRRPAVRPLQLAGAVVGEHVHTGERRDRRAAVDVSTGHGAPAGAGVRVLVDRGRRAVGRVAREAVGSLEAVPAEVVARALAGGHEVDLLPLVLADVADPEVARRRGRRRSATGCAARTRRSRAGRHRSRTGCRRGSSTAGRRRRCGSMRRSLPSSVSVDCPLPPDAWPGPTSAALPAVAAADVEQAVGAERELPAVVVRLGLVDREQLARRSRGRSTPSSTVYSTTRVSPSRSVKST